MDKKFIWQEIQEYGYSMTKFCQERDSPSLVEDSGKDSCGRTKVNLRLRFPQLLDITARINEWELYNDAVMHDWELDLLLHFYAALDKNIPMASAVFVCWILCACDDRETAEPFNFHVLPPIFFYGFHVVTVFSAPVYSERSIVLIPCRFDLRSGS